MTDTPETDGLKPILVIDEKEINRLARVLFEEEDRMLPDIGGETWGDLDAGRIAHYRNCVTAVLREATVLRIPR